MISLKEIHKFKNGKGKEDQGFQPLNCDKYFVTCSDCVFKINEPKILFACEESCYNILTKKEHELIESRYIEFRLMNGW